MTSHRSSRQPSTFAVRLDAGDDARPEELDSLTVRLRSELLHLDVADVRRATGRSAPDGVRALDAEMVGSLVVSIVTAPEILRALVSAVRDWLGRSNARSVTIGGEGDCIEVTGLTSAEQERIVHAWIARQAGG